MYKIITEPGRLDVRIRCDGEDISYVGLSLQDTIADMIEAAEEPGCGKAMQWKALGIMVATMAVVRGCPPRQADFGVGF